MGIELSFPETAKARTAKKTTDEWEADFVRIFGHELVVAVSNHKSPESFSQKEIEKRCDDRLPAAKKYLIAGGLPEKEVEEMPKFQIAMLYSLALCHENVDDAMRYFRLPYPEAIAAIRAAEKRVESDDREIVPISHLALPAVAISLESPTRLQRMIDVLRVLEALRLYGAEHEGKLPDTLASVVEAPIPNDPVTGKSFEYRIEGGRATLRGPKFMNQPLEYEITMAGAK
jgi:hypothetical protein